MRTTKEERADLRARCKAGVIAITTDAALVAALLDDVEELEAMADLAARRWAIAASEASGLRSELAAARAQHEIDVDYLRQAEDDRDRLIDALAAARAAMPTSVEWLALTGIYAAAVEHVTGGGEHRPTPTADRELDDVLGWFNRRTAYHAAHPAASSDGTGRAGGGGHE